MSIDRVKQKVKEVIITTMKLEIDPSQIRDDEPLFGGGLGLDSIDALDLTVALERVFQTKLEGERSVFTNVDTLAQYFAAEAGSVV